MAKKKFFKIYDVDNFREVFRTDDPMALVEFMNDGAVNLELHECWMSYDDKYPGAEFLKEKVKDRKMLDAAKKQDEFKKQKI